MTGRACFPLALFLLCVGLQCSTRDRTAGGAGEGGISCPPEGCDGGDLFDSAGLPGPTSITDVEPDANAASRNDDLELGNESYPSACDGPLDVPAEMLPLVSVGGALVDPFGRQVLLRGVNFSGMENGAVGVFEEEDFATAREYGFNAVRLPLGWKGFEPSPGEFNEEYLDEVERLVNLAEKHSLYVWLDMHQWFWSKAGMPEWTCPLEPKLSGDYLLQCAGIFFDSPEMQASFASVWGKVAKRFKGRAVIAGFDLLNEPPPPSIEAWANGTFESQTLAAFYSLVTNAVREADPKRTVVYEPCILSFGRTSLIPLPFDNLIFSPHIYVPHTYEEGKGLIWLMEPDTVFLTFVFLETLDSAETLGVPAVIGEYGAPPEEGPFAQWLEAFGQIADEHLTGTFYWEFNGGWGLFPPDSLVIKPFYIEHLIRPYVAAAAGTIVEMTARPGTGALHLVMQVPKAQWCNVTEIVLPRHLYPQGPKFSASPEAELVYSPENNRLYVRANRDTLTLDIMPGHDGEQDEP